MRLIKNCMLLLIICLGAALIHNTSVKAASNQDMIMDLEKPYSGQEANSNSLKISGWVLNKNGVKEVDIYLDNSLIGKTYINQNRPDVTAIYKSYIEDSRCGYEYLINLSKLSYEKHVISAEAIGNDGRKTYKAVVFYKSALKPKIDIESPASLEQISGSVLNITGWALNNSGIKEVDIYLDSTFLGQATTGISRKDVTSVYKGYKDGDNCGYQYNINLENVSQGKHTISAEQIGKDGSKNYKSIIIYVNITKLEPRLDIENPVSGAYVGDKILDISGWALCPSGVKEADVYVDSTMVGRANLGIARPDVNSVYSGYIGGANCGYEYKLDLSKLTSGKHTISVEAVGAKKEKTYEAKIIYVSKLSDQMDIESPKNNEIILINSTKNIDVSGWAISKSPLSTAKVLVDGKYIGQAKTGISRIDVSSLFPGYGVDVNDNCGYSFDLDISNYSIGTHTVCVQVTYKDGSTLQKQNSFEIKNEHLNGKVIVLDAGHNYGGDNGADGNGFSETTLNMQVVMKLKAQLEKEGAKIILTRNVNDRPTDSLSTSLENRVNIANNSNADLFISIHHDSSPSSSATGTSAYYSSYRHNIETQDVYIEIQENNVTIKNESESKNIGTANSGSRYKYICEKDSGFVIDFNGTRAWVSNEYTRAYDPTPSKQAVISKTLADRISQNISSLGLVNKGVTDRNLYVTRNTTMPSVLVEVGFISNPSEAHKISDSSFQDKVAEKIKDAVVSTFGN